MNISFVTINTATRAPQPEYRRDFYVPLKKSVSMEVNANLRFFPLATECNRFKVVGILHNALRHSNVILVQYHLKTF